MDLVVQSPDELLAAVPHVLGFKPEESKLRGDLQRKFKIVTDLPGEAPMEVVATLHVEP